jgi:hypothetical protein
MENKLAGEGLGFPTMLLAEMNHSPLPYNLNTFD